MEYLWAPAAALFVYFWSWVHRVDNRVASCEVQIDTIVAAVDRAQSARREIYDKVESVRADLTKQHSTLRKEQREDFKEIRKLVATLKE
jgi:hypothetical protein